MDTTIFTLYGPRAVLAALTAILLDDAAVECVELHKDADGDAYVFVTLDQADADLALDTYQAIEEAEGVTYEIAHEAVAA